MHPEAYQWVAEHATTGPVAVLDLGGRDINGTPRALFPGATLYRTVDIAPGPAVDIVADAATWVPDREYDVAVSTECFEHTGSWPRIVLTALAALRPGGLFIATMAGPGRGVHSGVDGGGTLHPGEHYANVDPATLLAVLTDAGFTGVTVDVRPSPADVRCVATKPE